MNYRPLLAIVLLLISTSSAESKGGGIQGKITVSQADDVTGEITRGRSLNRYQTGGANAEKPLDPPYMLSEKAVVFIESISGGYDPPSVHPVLDQRDMVFRPLVLPILVGTTVDFPNSDPLFHNVFSLSQAKEFDLGRYPQGEKKSVTFNKAGVVSVYCEIHSYMFATILVLQNPFFTVPDEDGNFKMTSIPPGTYQLSFWFGRKKAETRTVTVAEDQTTTVNFSY
ncbi:MAG: carboxypeptidase regulatory-like domain-containing protein [Bacteroidota bacterium]